jgi:cytidylate kinase
VSTLAGEILIVTGPPGAGKSTMARALVERFDRAVLLEGDAYFQAIVRGWIAPWTPPARDQNTVVTKAMGASAGEFARGGYAVVLEGIIGPWFLDTFVPAAGGMPVHYLIVRPTAEIAMDRAIAREAPALVDPEPIAHMYEAFESHDGYARHVLDTSDHTVDETVSLVLARVEEGALRL